MIILEGDPQGWSGGPGSSVALGVFDGVHRGHRAVIDAAVADGGTPTVLTFANHPAAVLDPAGAPPQLTSLDRKLELVASLGVEVAAVVPFDDELRVVAAEDFVRRFLVTGLRARHVAVGAGFRFGHRALGSVALLRDRGRLDGFTVTEIEPVRYRGIEVRSTAVRSAIGTGDLELANGLLARRYDIDGRVVPGEGRGRVVGIPTANLAIDPGLALPQHGVYAVVAQVHAERLDGVANLGVRPTFDGDRPTLEVHLLDWSGDLYGATIRLEFVARIRPERRFGNVEDLVAQIHRDIETARGTLSQTP